MKKPAPGSQQDPTLPDPSAGAPAQPAAAPQAAGAPAPQPIPAPAGAPAPQPVPAAAAPRDPVTGLYSVQSMSRAIDPVIQQIASGQIKNHLDLVYFNISGFKSYNIKYGFAKGDELLRRMADTLRAALGTDTAARYDADHFYAVVESSRTWEIIRTVHDSMALDSLSHMQVCAGIYRLTGKETSIGQALDCAKIAGDAAAGDFSKYWRHYDTSMEEALSLRSYLVREVNEAVTKGWIKVLYQPIVGTFSGKVEGVEALARWDDPIYGILTPSQFIDTLERGRLIYKIDMEVLRQVCQMIGAQRAEGKAYVPVSVNISRHDLELEDIHERINGILKSYMVPRQDIHIEITETALAQSDELVREHIRIFHDQGYEVWLDDFGSGYSSLNTLRGFGFDCAKLDMAFLRHGDIQEQERFIGDIVTTAKHLGLKTLAEGVETAEQFQMLKRVGCMLTQGYLYSKPAPILECVKRLTERGYGTITREEKLLFDDLGMTDVRDGSYPFEQGSLSTEYDDPFCIIVDDNGDLRTVYANAAAIDFAHSIGFTDYAPDHGSHLNEMNWVADLVRSGIRPIRDIGESHEVSVSNAGWTGVVHLQLISVHGSSRAYLVTADKGLEDDVPYRRELNDICTLFDTVAVICPKTDEVVGVHGSLFYGQEATLGKDQGFATMRQWYAEHMVYPSESARFLDFLDSDTLDERTQASPTGVIESFFDLRASANAYELKRMVVARVQSTSHPRYLVCIARNRSGWTRELLNRVRTEAAMPQEEVSSWDDWSRVLREEQLWRTVMDGGTLGIFWKDADRRFLGANRMFLDYYGLELSDILGKNDEDIGWHPDPEPFKADELRVLSQGATVHDALGKCMVRGRVRDIAATKMPIYEGGQIVGLLGYFIDVTEVGTRLDNLRVNAFQQLRKEIYADPVTGMPDANGLRDLCEELERRYDGPDTDFGYISIQIMGMHRFGETYGVVARDDLFRLIGDTLQRVVSDQDVVGRLYDGRFAIIARVHATVELETLEKMVVQALDGIHEVDGIPCTVYYASGSALYSAHNDFGMMTAAADFGMMVGFAAKSNTARFSHAEIIKIMRDCQPAWDHVRIIEPESMEARILSDDGRLVSLPGRCCMLMGHNGRCPGCIGLKTIESGRSLRKFIALEDQTYYVVTQMVVLDGRPQVLEKDLLLDGKVGSLSDADTSLLEDRVARLERENDRLRSEARLDSLTGLLNRSGFEEIAKPLFEGPNKTLMITADINDFKLFNDRWGHAAGDALLRDLADKLNQTFDGWVVARTGGDEFQIVVSPADQSHVARAREFFEGLQSFGYDSVRRTYTMAAGWTITSHTTLHMAAKQADKALYHEKLMNSGEFCQYQPSFDRDIRDSLGFSLRDLSAGIPSAVFAYQAGDPEKILFANEYCWHLFGCRSYEEFIDHVGGSFHSLVHPDDIDWAEHEIWEQIESKDNYDHSDYVVYRIITRDGTVKKVLDTGKLIQNDFYGDIFYVILLDYEEAMERFRRHTRRV